MGLRGLSTITGRLLAHGATPDTPAAVIASATLPEERTVVGTLATIAELAQAAGIAAPATLVVGEVVRVRDLLTALGDGTTPESHANTAVLIEA
jgi:siroheme synthase